MNKLMSRLALVLTVCLLAMPVKAAILPPPEQVSDHVYAWIGPLEGPNEENQGYRMNLAFVVGRDAVLVFDTGYSREMAEEMVAHIAEVTPLPIRYAVNSNSQPHRHFGNDVFYDLGAEIFTTAEEQARMRDMAGMFGIISTELLGRAEGENPPPNAPVTLIEDEHTLSLGGGVEVRLETVGGNHTPNSVIAEVAADKVIMTGDVLYAERLLSILDVSDIENWIEVFDGLRDYDGYTMVPGHGAPTPLSGFEQSTYIYLTSVWGHMMTAIDEGEGMDSAVKSFDQSPWKDLANFELLSGRNASWAFQQAEFASF